MGNLTYDGCKVNEGSAMKVSNGILTAPRKASKQSFGDGPPPAKQIF